MVRKGDYIPKRDDDFFNFQGNLDNEVVANAVAWGILAAAVAALVARRAVYEPLYTKSQNKGNRTQADVLAHRQMRNVYEKEIRVFDKAYLMFNPLVTDEDRRRMRLTVRDIEPTPRPEITTAPIVGLKGMESGRIEVRCRVTTDQTRPSMPKAANEVAVNYILVERGDIAPENPEKCPEKIIISKSKFIIDAGAENAGKQFYGFFRWMNTSRLDRSGPWSKVHTVIVP